MDFDITDIAPEGHRSESCAGRAPRMTGNPAARFSGTPLLGACHLRGIQGGHRRSLARLEKNARRRAGWRRTVHRIYIA